MSNFVEIACVNVFDKYACKYYFSTADQFHALIYTCNS